jgi:polysaccharide export outer membrane protein
MMKSMSGVMLGVLALFTVAGVPSHGQVLSTVGGAVTLGPAPGTFFQPAPSPVVDESLLNSLMNVPAGAVLLAPDDQVKINLYGVKDFETAARVERDGTVQVPYLGPVKLAGLTVIQAENLISAGLISKQLVLEPSVQLVVTSQPSATVLVAGEIPHPGPYPIFSSSTLDRVIAAGGGFLTDASPVVTISRIGYPSPIVVPLGPDPAHSRFGGLPLLPGDRVLVSRVGLYYVVGAIKNQGSYNLKSTTPTTVMQALAAAGGYGYEGLLDQTQIVRTQGDHRIFIPVHAGKIVQGKEADVALLNDDIVFVPTSKTKAAIKAGATGFVVSLATSYLYTR